MGRPTDQQTSRPVFMLHALELAKRSLGKVGPSAAVGCVIIKNNVIVGRGWTQAGGRPHAEAMALAQAGDAAYGADMYVTLEPCFMPGRGAPCTQSMIDAGLKKVFVAIRDPNPRVNGQGIAALRAAGIEVVEGLCADEAAQLNKGFLLLQTQQRPMVTLKLAISADGKMTTGDKNNRWITGEAARRHGHLLRANHDAIMIGIGTALADDPMLDCRIVGLEKYSPVRVILDSKNQFSENSKLKQTSDKIPLLVLAEKDPLKILHELAAKRISRVLIEGGAKVAQSFLAAGLVDEVVIYQSPNTVGGQGLSAPELPEDFRQKSEIQLGLDSYKYY
ncbi:MAG TPA: bifunctional diaminohydroxyphosphoribosylaminopyrimidine deaminase/5-amino-6-(5-phosphoribosylamino)uracil reductase RibD, partial [Alphaproteobacteria bacterium]|nr:bifunctional diaminohydroxyphosphoribosylaminopyrimidine deaminase/5-amino-6-(5-phosphoribosylamino)uracil reductase RibD [Alphaproteobacteria bacterium]